MRWLSNPKVRLGLIVNGIYFLSLFTPPQPHERPRVFPSAPEPPSVRTRAEVLPDYMPPAPHSGPVRARAAAVGSGLLVTLNDDLTLVNRLNRVLLLVPSIGMPAGSGQQPRSVLLRFVLFSDGGVCPNDCRLTISADGETVWPDPRLGSGGYAMGWRSESNNVPPPKLFGGRRIEMQSAESYYTEIPYELFLDLIASKQVVVELGADRVELTAEQLAALRDLQRRVPPPVPLNDARPGGHN